MLTLLSRSLRHTSSLAATTASMATNIVATGLLGQLLFGERTSSRWWVGVICIWCGAWLLRPPEQPAETGSSRGDGTSSDSEEGGGERGRAAGLARRRTRVRA